MPKRATAKLFVGPDALLFLAWGFDVRDDFVIFQSLGKTKENKGIVKVCFNVHLLIRLPSSTHLVGYLIFVFFLNQ